MTLEHDPGTDTGNGSSTTPAAAEPERKRRYRQPGVGMISPAEAFRDYLELGQGRSIASLHRIYSEAPHKSGKRPPSHDTMRRWSGKYRWAEQAAKHDRELAQVQNKAVIERLAKDAADTAAVLAGAAELFIASALERRYEMTPDQAAHWGHRLAETAHTMVGGVTERSEQRVITADATDHLQRWLTAAQEAEQAAQQTAGSAADKPKVIDVDAQDIEPADAKPTNDQ